MKYRKPSRFLFELYIELTSRRDTRLADWWENEGQYRYPNLPAKESQR